MPITQLRLAPPQPQETETTISRVYASPTITSNKCSFIEYLIKCSCLRSRLLHRTARTKREMIPVSPPASVNGEDSPIPQPGFGWEFPYILEARVRKKELKMHARFQRYARFGMQWEEARLPTPDHFRNAYDELLDAIANDRTPSPSPEAQTTITVTQNLQREDTAGEDKSAWAEGASTRGRGSHHTINTDTRGTRPTICLPIVQNSLHIHHKNRITKQNQTRAVRVPRGRGSGTKRPDHRARTSIHGMMTRSKAVGLQKTRKGPASRPA